MFRHSSAVLDAAINSFSNSSLKRASISGLSSKPCNHCSSSCEGQIFVISAERDRHTVAPAPCEAWAISHLFWDDLETTGNNIHGLWLEAWDCSIFAILTRKIYQRWYPCCSDRPCCSICRESLLLKRFQSVREASC